MGESSDNLTGFNSRAAGLLNNQKFCDVEIQVKDGSNHKTFLAHKLFLSMSSQEFAAMFYGKFESPKFIKIFDFRPQTVYLMLQYIYTDNCDLSSMEETKQVYLLSKKYRIDDLGKYCVRYLSKEDITLDNIFDKYEFVLTEKIDSALEDCRALVSIEAAALLKSPEFSAAPLSVVEDILKQETINVKSEIELIEAAVEWARQECLRRGSFTENLRICLYPLFKYLRFLSLTPIEFCDFVEKYENILNSHESAMLTMSILKPSSPCRLPSGFSSNSSPRLLPAKKVEIKSQPNTVKDNLFPTHPSFNTVESNLESVFKSHLMSNNNLNKTKHVDKSDAMLKLVEPSFEKNLFIKSDRGFSADYINSTMELKSTKELHYELKSEALAKDVEYINHSNQNTGLFKVTDYNFNEQKNKYGISAPMNKKSDSGPVLSRKQFPVLKVSPQITMNQRRTFEFPLQDFKKNLTSAFPDDIKCSATIHLHRGAMEIYGIELKIQEKENDNDIKAFLSVVGPDRSSFTSSYDDQVKNGMFSMEFSESLKLAQGSYINIEVTVEDLVLNRCYGYCSDKCELNCGLNLKAEITMKSNQFDEEQGYFFTISRLFYKPC